MSVRALIPLCLSLTAVSYHFVVVFTPATPKGITEQIKGEIEMKNREMPANTTVVEVTSFLTFRLDFWLRSHSEVVIDVGFSATASKLLSEMCVEAEIAHFALMPVEDETAVGRWTYAVGGSFRGYAEAIKAVKAFFKFKTVNVLSDVSDLSLFFTAALLREEKYEYDLTFFPEDSNESKVIGKIVRPKGNRVSVVTSQPGVAKKIMKAQQQMHIGGVGFGNILPLVSSLYDVHPEDTEDIFNTGNLIIAEVEFADVRTQSQYFHTGVSLIISYFSELPAIKSLQGRVLPMRYSPRYVLLNQQSGRLVHVGDIANGTYIPLAEVVFLGNTTVIPRNSTSPINISGNFGNTDPVGFFAYLTPMYAGSLLAISDVNKRSDILPNFNIELWNFTGGYSRFNETYLKTEIMPQRYKFGAAMIASISSSFNIPFLWLLEKYNDSTPVIGSAITFPLLSSKEAFPNFVRTAISDEFMDIVIVQIFRRFGWTKCGFLAEDLFSIGKDAQTQFQKLMSESGISIVNSPEHQLLPTNITSVDQAIEQFRDSLQHFIDTHVRVLLIVAVYIPKYIPIVLYELGLRRGDVIIIAREWLASTSFDSLSPEELFKAGEIMTGALQFYPDRFVGNFGQKVMYDFQNTFGTTPSTRACFYYDSAYAIAVSLDWLVVSGQDYMNHTVMMAALRQSRFTGCTGIVSFETNSNDRNEVRFVLETIVFNGITPSMQRVGRYDPHGMVLLSINPNYTWPDGTTTVPKDTRNSTIDCPFEDRLDTYFPQGEYLLIGLSVTVILFSLCVSVISWRLLRMRRLEHLLERKEIEVEDILVMLSVLIECIQLLSLGPSLLYISASLQAVLDGFIWEGKRLLPLHNGGYQKMWIFTEVWMVLWLLSTVSTYLCRKRKEDYSLKFLEIVSYAIQAWLFTPIVSILMDTFVCRNGVASTIEPVTFSESYLEADCYMCCWRSTHIFYFSVSVVSLGVFITVATVQGYLWQDLQPNLHIKSSVGYAMTKAFLSVSLIAAMKMTKSVRPLHHGLIYMLIAIGYLAFSVCKQCFGYIRTRFWHIISLTIVVWTAMISTARIICSNSSDDSVFISLSAIGWTLILSSALLFQALKLPSFLYRQQGINTVHLFKFAFQRVTASIISNLQAEFNRVGGFSRTLRRNYSLDSNVELQSSSPPAAIINLYQTSL